MCHLETGHLTHRRQWGRAAGRHTGIKLMACNWQDLQQRGAAVTTSMPHLLRQSGAGNAAAASSRSPAICELLAGVRPDG